MNERVELYGWNPSRPVIRGPLGRRIPLRVPVNNFGDMLGPELVRALLRRRGISNAGTPTGQRLLSIGSILHHAMAGDSIWGSGVNGKELGRSYSPESWKIRAVRGPLSRQFLVERGGDVPEIYGDPGILTSILFPRASLPQPRFRRAVTIVPNLHDYPRLAHLRGVLNPRLPLLQCLATIAESEFVVGSSLHGIIVAESYGIGARRISASREPDFKYDDYYLGTGRASQLAAKSVDEALELGPAAPARPNVQALLDSFPVSLWQV